MNDAEYNKLDRKTLFEAEDYLSPESGYPERSVEAWFKPLILPKVLEHSINKEAVLDVGCAFGYISRILSDHFKYVLAIDLAQNRVDYAKQYEKLWKLDFKQVDLTQVELASITDIRFDTAYTSAVIQHIPLAEKSKAIRNIASIINPGGRLIMFDHRDTLDIRDDFVGSYNESYFDKNYSDIFKLLRPVEFICDTPAGETWFYLFEKV